MNELDIWVTKEPLIIGKKRPIFRKWEHFLFKIFIQPHAFTPMKTYVSEFI